jgi:hypothetical protein
MWKSPSKIVYRTLLNLIGIFNNQLSQMTKSFYHNLGEANGHPTLVHSLHLADISIHGASVPSPRKIAREGLVSLTGY